MENWRWKEKEDKEKGKITIDLSQTLWHDTILIEMNHAATHETLCVSNSIKCW